MRLGILGLGGLLVLAHSLAGQGLPRVEVNGSGSSRLLVGGKPYLVLGGELGNSAAGTAAQADEVLPRVAAAHVNTVLMPVAWGEIEPAEGTFDFGVLDHWLAVARDQRLHLVLLWFGSWKNARSSYAPEWVKGNPGRFARVIGEDGQPREILSTFSEANVQADARAFARLMQHVREVDGAQQTVLMVQVENEVGVLESGRDRSAAADRAFAEAVPATLRTYMTAHTVELPPELSRVWRAAERTWRGAFGERADESFMAWHYASYVQTVAKAGKAEYALPMFMNAQLPSPVERAGEYPSGAPHPANLPIYRAGATALDFLSPDIYWPEFEQWMQRYEVPGNALFVPEARLEASQWNVLYALGEARAMGFSPFAIESVGSEAGANSIAGVYGLLGQLAEMLPAAQAEGRTRGMVMHVNSPRATQTVSLGGYLFQGGLARSWPANALLQDDGGVLVMELAPDDFVLVGSAMRLEVRKDVDAGAGTAGIARVEEGQFVNGRWTVKRVLNGDQTNQGRSVLLPAKEFSMLRVKLYTIR